MWQVFEADSANQLYGRVLDALRGDAGVHVQPSRAGDTREILHAALTLHYPRRRWITGRRPAMNPAFALAEVFWILGGRRDAHFVRYFNRSLVRHAGPAECLHGAYGHRLRRHFGVDQLQRAYETLRTNPNSRQVVLQIWDPKLDLPHSDGAPRDPDIPCNTQAMLKLRAGRLEWMQIMRSNDVFLGLPHNLIQFTMLHEVLAGWLGVNLGSYQHVSDSLHLYERDNVWIDNAEAEIPADDDEFALPKSESDRVISTVVDAIELIVDENHPPSAINERVEQVVLPKSFRNALCVMAAEALRRRNDLAAADALMRKHCTSRTFSLMWANWCHRVLHKDK